MPVSDRGILFSAPAERKPRRRGVPPARVKCQRGFTLAEFFVAIIIFSIIALALFYSLNTSLKVYRTQSEFEGSLSGIDILTHVMEKELLSAVAMNDIRLVGTARSMYFFAPRVFPDTDYPLNKITYQSVDDENSLSFIERTSENPFSEDKGEEFSGNSFIYRTDEPVKNVQFKYYLYQQETGGEEGGVPGGQWKDSWEEEFFPDAVKIEYTSVSGEDEIPSDVTIVLGGPWGRPAEEEKKEE
ncbi:MAG: prepilin-type N-terminal cleavage/methylation domain-containing protein [Candidatus Aureabacteria bacterium]|nr:prepilin-type N-terminal cleavage/methylation domain-containing protein [Candidatus Auribacterota bacterium]